MDEPISKKRLDSPSRIALARIASAACAIASFGLSAHPGGVDEDGCHIEAKTQQRHCHHAHVVDPGKPAKPGDEGVFYGPLVSVKDGDTFQVKVQGVVMDFRLAGVDAPESDQPYGDQARQTLAALIGKRQCVLVPIDTDRYGRTVAFLWIGDVYVNREMVNRGAAWFYSEFASDASLFDVEEGARAQRRGLWSLPLKDRIEPSQWRRERRS
jgi:endonuclease YncB( thermonuclease family)